MPRFAMSPDEYKSKFRNVSLNIVYFNMLYEICNEYIGIESISQCLYLIIKDLYDTLTMSRTEKEEVKEKYQPKRKKVKEEEILTSIRPPPPP